MKTCLTVLLVCLLACQTCAAQASGPRVFAAAQVKADLAYAYTTLAQAHYNLFAYVSKRRFDRAYAALVQSVGPDSLSLLQTTKLLQQLAAVANTGHCEVDFAAPSYIAYARAGGTVFPLELAFEDGVAYVRKSYVGPDTIRPGDQLLSIDDVAIKKIQAGIYPYLSAERPYFKATKLELYSFPRLYWEVFGAKAGFRVRVKSASGAVATHWVAALPALAYEARRGGEIVGTRRSLRYVNSVACLNPGPFSAAGADGEARFRQFIDSAFAVLRARQTTRLLLDLRNNTGGDDAYSDYLLAYIASRPFRWYSTFRLRTSAVLKQRTPPAAPPAVPDAYTAAIFGHADGETFAYDLPLHPPVPVEARFQGQVLVLINRHSYSMAAVGAATAQDAGFARLVGEETGDRPTLYAAQFAFPLPNTGLLVKVPKGYLVRPSGRHRRSGVRPDYAVRDHLLDEHDEILAYAVAKILSLPVGKP
jgi:hypothetical protein